MAKTTKSGRIGELEGIERLGRRGIGGDRRNAAASESENAAALKFGTKIESGVERDQSAGFKFSHFTDQPSGKPGPESPDVGGAGRLAGSTAASASESNPAHIAATA